MKGVTTKRDFVVGFLLAGVIVAATWVRIYRTDFGYATARTLSYYAYGAYVDHNLIETLFISLGGGLLGGYISWVVMKDWAKIKAKFKRRARHQ